MKPTIRIILLSLSFLIFTSSKNRVDMNDYPVTVIGYFFGFDGSNQFPLKGARVELMDSDADGSDLFDDIMGSSYINDDGSFKITGSGGDPGGYSWSKPDGYVRVVFNNDKGVRLTNEIDQDRYA